MARTHNPPSPLSDTRFRFDDWYPAFGPDACTSHVPHGYMTMTEAAHRVGERLLICYDRDFPLLATLPSIPVIATDLAFTEERAVDAVHERYAPLMRAVDAFCTLAGGSILAKDDDVWRTIGSDRFASPHPFRDFDGFVAVFGGGEPISRADWDFTLIELGGWRSLGMMARRTITAAAGVLTTLAATGGIRTVRVPIHGAACFEPIERDDWNITFGLERMAIGAYDPRDPLLSDGRATHLILVEQDGFDAAIVEPCAQREIDPFPSEARDTSGRPYPYADLLDDLVADMAILLAQPGHETWRSTHLRMALPGLDGRYRQLDDGIFRKAKETLFGLDIKEIGSWADRRPSKVEEAALENLRDRKFDRESLKRKLPDEVLRKLPRTS
jgi:hypothetical protein